MTQELHVWTEKYLESDSLQETWPDSYNNQEKIILTVKIVWGAIINQFLVDTILWFMIEYLVEELRR